MIFVNITSAKAHLSSLLKKLEDDEEYKELMKKGVTPMPGPSGLLFYLDYQYGSTSSTI